MHPDNAKGRDRAEKRGHLSELWSRRPLAGWAKNAAHKLMARRIERRRRKQEIARNDR